jgi:hypothetical protein
LSTSNVAAFSGNEFAIAATFADRGRLNRTVPCVPNPVIALYSAEKSSVLASYDLGYFRSFLT